jgi:transcriptional regulator with XRE-family HTH domain
MPLLQRKIKNLLRDFHDLDRAAVDFDLAYDLTALFAEKQYLNLSGIASKMGINRSLMAQYAAGKKHPSFERAKEIENVIHDLGRDLLQIKLALNGSSLRRSRTTGSRKKDNLKKKV